MKKILAVVICLVLAAQGRSQLLSILQSPPGGYTYKPQLWTMVLTNTGNTPLNIHIEVTLHAVSSNQQVLSAVTRIITLAPGVNQIGASQLMPIQYNVAASPFNIDANPLGLLPIGSFEACYYFFKHVSDNIEQITEQCQEIVVEPLSPPQLIYPYDRTGIEEEHPQFSWLPPVPSHLFSNLRYDLVLVEVNGNQSAADAVQQNVPIYQGVNLSTNIMLYPLSATSLELNKEYAWRVTAKSGDAVVGSSESWQFHLKQFGTLTPTAPTAQPFVQLRKDPENAYAIFIGEIKFSYLNETVDSVWNVKLTDLSDPARATSNISMDTVQLKRGINLVKHNAGEDSFFTDRHVYQLEVRNSRNEVWRIRFEYRRPNENESNQNN